VGALFPDVAAVCEPRPITGFRILAPGRLPAGLPEGYGVETFLNLRLALDGLLIEVVDLGLYDGPLKAYANIERIALDMRAAILDLAQAEGRLAASMRPAWEEWSAAVIDHTHALPVPPTGRADFEERLMELVARPLPATRPTATPR
jgi:glucosyl-3-phosphoglycerate synthase